MEGLIMTAGPIRPADPAGSILPIPSGAVSYCSGPTGDCWWLREDPNWQQIPGEVPSIEIGDTGGSFRASVRGHELERVALAWLKTIIDLYGLDAVKAILDADPANETLDPHIYELISEDAERSDVKQGRTSWRDRLPKPATA